MDVPLLSKTNTTTEEKTYVVLDKGEDKYTRKLSIFKPWKRKKKKAAAAADASSAEVAVAASAAARVVVATEAELATEAQLAAEAEAAADGSTILQLACQRGLIETVKHLCETGCADANETSKDNSGKTPLHFACESGHLEIVTYLCDMDRVDVNVISKNGYTPLHFACQCGHLEIVKYLCDLDQVDTNVKTQDGYTPLHLTCYGGRLEIMKCLSDVDRVDVNVLSKGGYSPLHFACQCGYLEMVKYLCDMDRVDVNVITKGGYTPLLFACQCDHLEIVKYLCDMDRVDVNVKDEYGYTPLHFVCQYGHLEIAKYLCDVVLVDVNVKDENGYTPLHFACQCGRLEVVKYLFAMHRVDLNVLTKEGLLSVALRFKRLDIFTVLCCQKEITDDLPDKFPYKSYYGEVMKEAGLQSEPYIRALGVEYFTFPETGFFPFDRLSDVTLFASGEYGNAYTARMDITHALDVEKEYAGPKITIRVVCKASENVSGVEEWYELQTLQNLPNHKNVVGLVAMCTGFRADSDGTLLSTAMIFNYKSGGSLLGLLEKKRENPFSLQQLCLQGLDILSGISHMHSNYFKHCDIAARNILISKHRHGPALCVSDFGLSRPITHTHDAKTRFPITWCAPETLMSGKTSSQSDIWMIAVTFVELASYPYRKPYQAGFFSPVLLLNSLRSGNHCYSQSSRRRSVPTEWIELCKLCFTLSKDDRPSLEQLSDKLKLLLERIHEDGEKKQEDIHAKDMDVGATNIKLSSSEEYQELPNFSNDAAISVFDDLPNLEKRPSTSERRYTKRVFLENAKDMQLNDSQDGCYPDPNINKESKDDDLEDIESIKQELYNTKQELYNIKQALLQSRQENAALLAKYEPLDAKEHEKSIKD